MQAIQLQAIAKRSAHNLLGLLEEHEEEILRAIAAMEEEAQNQEAAKCVITLNHAIKLDLTGKSQNDSLSYSVRTKLETVHTLPNPAEPELPGMRDPEFADTAESPLAQSAKSFVKACRKSGCTVSITNPNTGKGVEISAGKITPIQ